MNPSTRVHSPRKLVKSRRTRAKSPCKPVRNPGKVVKNRRKLVKSPCKVVKSRRKTCRNPLENSENREIPAKIVQISERLIKFLLD